MCRDREKIGEEQKEKESKQLPMASLLRLALLFIFFSCFEKVLLTISMDHLGILECACGVTDKLWRHRTTSHEDSLEAAQVGGILTLS